MWNFRRKHRGEKIRNPIQGEFFATEAIANPAQALVREAVQNSLDARLGDQKVRVHIRLATADDALSPRVVARFFDGAWAHYAALGNGLREPPSRDSSCSFLVVEDFGTKGLTGDPLQADEPPGTVNPFLLFFRAEGLSAKSGTQLGRWGVGKFVFPRSSQASTHFGLTVRHDDRRRLLLGAATLKAHRVADDDAMYSPDGLFGRAEQDGFVAPFEGDQIVDEFVRLFGLARTDEPGLSVVVPFLDPDISFEQLLVSAVRDYFLPILHNSLEIVISSSSERVYLAAEQFDDVLRRYEKEFGPETRGFVQLARWAGQVGQDERIRLESQDPSRSAKWAPELVPEYALQAIRQGLEHRKPLAIRVPVWVRQKGAAPVESHFDIYLLSDKSAEGRPLFVREGIIVADARGARAKEVRSLVMIEDKLLAGMLGDSENPAHTQWQKDSSNFRGKYVYGPGMIDFVTGSVREILAIATQSAIEADPSLTVDYFSIEPQADDEEASDADARRAVPRKGSESDGPDVEVVPNRTRISITRTPGGFSVQPGPAAPIPPYSVEVRCAYDIRTGNPLKKWSPADFELQSPEFSIEVSGKAEATSRANTILVHVLGGDFGVKVTGFDGARDVYVRANVRSREDADTQA